MEANTTVDTSSTICFHFTAIHLGIGNSAWHHVMNLVLNTLFSITAIVGNSLVLFAMHKTGFLNIKSNILLLNLALTDLGVGFIVQPLFVLSIAAKLAGLPQAFCYSAIAYDVTSACLCGVTLLTVTAITLDKYVALHLHLQYEEIVTFRRIACLLLGIWFGNVLGSSAWLWSVITMKIISVFIILLCIPVTVVANLKTYKIVRRHQVQIEALQIGQVQAAPHMGNSTNMTQSRKSAVNILLIYCLVLTCYLPFLVAMGVVVATGTNALKQMVLEFTNTILFVNSSLNPILYCWRLSEIRKHVLQTVQRIFCRQSQE